MPEEKLILKCKSGDGESFRQLIKLYKNQLFGYLLRFTNSKDVAEELFQETLIKVWKGIKKYNHNKKFSSWLFTIAHNVAMDFLRKNKSTFTNYEEIISKPSNENLEETIIKNETLEIINESINNLSQKQKAVFLLRQHGEMTFKEIAKVTGEPLNTVISHMHYSIKRIKKQIELENEPRRKKVN